MLAGMHGTCRVVGSSAGQLELVPVDPGQALLVLRDQARPVGGDLAASVYQLSQPAHTLPAEPAPASPVVGGGDLGAHLERAVVACRRSGATTWAIQPACASIIAMIELPPRLVLGP